MIIPSRSRCFAAVGRLSGPLREILVTRAEISGPQLIPQLARSNLAVTQDLMRVMTLS